MYCIVYVFVVGKLQAARSQRHESGHSIHKYTYIIQLCIYIYRQIYLELEPIVAIAGVSISVG